MDGSTSVGRPARPSLVVLGDLALDVIACVDGALERGSDAPGRVTFRAGGSAANTARAFALLGGRAQLISSVGRDAWARRLSADLRRDGVGVRLARVGLPTARLVVSVEGDGERSFVTDRGAADLLAPEHLRRSWFRGVGALHLPAYSLLTEPLASAARAAVALARDTGATISTDLASRAPLARLGTDGARALVASVTPDIVFGNADEFAVITSGEPTDTVRDLAPLVVVKRGAAGCRVLSTAGDDPVDLEVPAGDAVTADTTGAGDAFDAGFLYSLLSSAGEGPASTERLGRCALGGHAAAFRLLTGPRRDLEG